MTMMPHRQLRYIGLDVQGDDRGGIRCAHQLRQYSE